VTRSAPIGVLGATSLVGRPLLDRLACEGRELLACSRFAALQPQTAGMTWWRPGEPLPSDLRVGSWIALCPLWFTVEAFDWLVASGATRLVALSSTSAVTKARSPDAGERRLADRLLTAENELEARVRMAGLTLIVLRSTMIYNGTSDQNTARIAAFVRRFRWFPIAGPALGLRQPVHADDVAAACIAALAHPAPKGMYTISGGEALPFREFVERICHSHGLPPRLVPLPRLAWHVASLFSDVFSGGDWVTAGTATRMNDDLSCDHAAATQDLGFRPRPFQPSPSCTVPATDTATHGATR
jgi:nucleoside-diphosphate-sugar epimerase